MAIGKQQKQNRQRKQDNRQVAGALWGEFPDVKKRSRSSIATRWFVNSFVAVALILIIIAVTLFFMLRQYYYGTVEQILQSEANIISGVLSRYYETLVYPNEIRHSIEEFDKKDSMELMALSPQGEIMLTSSGFSPPANHSMPDFISASENADGFGRHIGRTASSEKYMAVTLILPSSENSVYGAIRLITSLEAVDSQLYTFTLFVGIVSIATLLLLLFLGFYFIGSIVSPLRQIGATAQRLADGDFSVRVARTKNNDEIGDLCKVINHMADELENSESLKNEFISSVSHELRTPLTAIKGWGETVLELKDNDTTEKGMRVIITETDRLTVMVEELLDFSRMQNGTLILQKNKINILEELTSATEVYAERANKEHITIELDTGKLNPVFINGDKHRIRQVFLNIIDNAIKYSNKDSAVKISVETNSEKNTVTIVIADKGCGISRADLPNVKMKFFKANNTKRGSGIGLAVVDEIVSLHDGRVDISSRVGKGTVVKVTFPVVV